MSSTHATPTANPKQMAQAKSAPADVATSPNPPPQAEQKPRPRVNLVELRNMDIKALYAKAKEIGLDYNRQSRQGCFLAFSNAVKRMSLFIEGILAS